MFATFVIFATKNALITILIMYTCHGSCKLFFLVTDGVMLGHVLSNESFFQNVVLKNIKWPSSHKN